MVRVINLTALSLVGLLAGYLGLQFWRSDVAHPSASPPGEPGQGSAAVSDEAPPSPQPGLSQEPIRSRARSMQGSSLSVVGGLSPEDLRRLGVQLPPEALPAQRPTAVPLSGPSAGQPLEGPPAAGRFPPTVAKAAGGFRCLCGCPHNLAVCPCNQQPVGAVTMLTYLEKLLDQGKNGDAARQGMVDRYGERVVADSPRP
ncbi:MAG: hypothetical protein ACE5ID_10130 [Acidobacteriota bacterium]